MRKQFLSKLSCTKAFTALAIIGGIFVPLSSTQADTSQISPNQFQFGSPPTDYKQFSEPTPTAVDQGSSQTRTEGPQGPIRTDEMNDMSELASYPATSAGREEQSEMNRSQQTANKGLYGELPTNYRWYR